MAEPKARRCLPELTASPRLITPASCLGFSKVGFRRLGFRVYSFIVDIRSAYKVAETTISPAPCHQPTQKVFGVVSGTVEGSGEHDRLPLEGRNDP